MRLAEPPPPRPAGARRRPAAQEPPAPDLPHLPAAMAGRAHKRLLQEQLGAAPALAEQPPSEEESGSGSESVDDAPTGTVFNPFSLLTDDEVGGAPGALADSMSPPRCS